MWHAPALGRLSRAWQDEQIVYLPRSGETHYLNPSATDILARLSLAPASTESLHQSLVQSRDPAPSAEEVRSIISRLCERGLIEDT